MYEQKIDSLSHRRQTNLNPLPYAHVREAAKPQLAGVAQG